MARNTANLETKKIQNNNDISVLSFLLIETALAKYIPKPNSVNTTNKAPLANNETYKPYSLIPNPEVNNGIVIIGANILINVAEILLKILEITVLDNFIYGSVPVHFEDELFGAVELDYGPESINDKIQQIPQPPKLFLQGFPVSKFAQERQERLRLRPILDGLVGYRRECSQ